MTKTKFSKVEIIKKFNDAGISVKSDRKINYGCQLTFENDAKISVYKTGKISVQGKDAELSNSIIYGKPEELNVGKAESVKHDEKLDDTELSIIEDDDEPPW